MKNLFPLNSEIGQIRAILKLVKENKGKIGLASLSKEINEDIDTLLPYIETGKALGFINVKEGMVGMTPLGRKIKLENYQKIVRDRIKHVEPFKSVISILSKEEITTEELAKALHGKEIVLYADKTTNELLLRNLLISWGVRCKLLKYDAETDLWSLEKAGR